MRVEGTWRQLADVHRGGILADWYVLSAGNCTPILFSCLPARPIGSAADSFLLSEQEHEENFESLIAPLETDVIPCLGDDRVPDYLIVHLARSSCYTNWTMSTLLHRVD